MLQVPLYLSEIAPPKWRGTLNLLFQCFTIFGILAAACINYGTVRTHWGWRLSLGLAAVPAMILGLGALLLPDSPNSLVFRGKIEQGRKVLEGYRGGQPSHTCAKCMLSCSPRTAQQSLVLCTILDKQGTMAVLVLFVHLLHHLLCLCLIHMAAVSCAVSSMGHCLLLWLVAAGCNSASRIPVLICRYQPC